MSEVEVSYLYSTEESACTTALLYVSTEVELRLSIKLRFDGLSSRTERLRF